MPRTFRPVAPHRPGTDDELVAPLPVPRRQPRPPAAPVPPPVPSAAPQRMPVVPGAETTMVDVPAHAELSPDARAQSDARKFLLAH